MNAVNLIPSDRRRRRTEVSAGAPFYGLIAGLVLVLIATVLYVNANNQVASRRAELARVSAGVTGWTTAANSYSTFVHAAQQHATDLADVSQLATSRFDWSRLLDQLAGLMPTQTAITTLQATTPGSTSASPSTSSTGTAGSGIQLSACAASQSIVAQTMVQLRQITGVTGVTLSSATSSASGASSGASSSSGSCRRLPIQFQVSLTFASASPTAAATATTATGAATATSAPTGTAAAAAPSTSTSGAAQ